MSDDKFSPYNDCRVQFPPFRYGSGEEAMIELSFSVLTTFIIHECANSDLKDEDYALPGEGEEGKYRNIRYGYYGIGENEKKVIDLYWWWKVEFPKYKKEVEEDFRLWRELPEGEPRWIYPKKTGKGFNMGKPNPKRKYPDYKRKFEIRNLAYHFKDLRREKFLELAQLSNYMEF